MAEDTEQEEHRTGQAGARWNDPRQNPSPPAPAREPAEDPSEVEELVRLCKLGRIYAVERWIAGGKPVQARKYYVPGRRQIDSPLAAALDTRQQDLALLLLANGYRIDLEPWSPLTTTISRRAWDLVELLLQWGASPADADPETVLNSYDIETIERFWSLGLDCTEHDCLAWYLSTSTRNRPAYGWSRRHHSEPRVARALAFALVQAISEKREKAAHLCVWAGADAHRKVPILKWKDDSVADEEQDCCSAIELAVDFGVGKLLRALRPIPDVDDIDALLASAVTLTLSTTWRRSGGRPTGPERSSVTCTGSQTTCSPTPRTNIAGAWKRSPDMVAGSPALKRRELRISVGTSCG
jgi:hypothetical protein